VSQANQRHEIAGTRWSKHSLLTLNDLEQTSKAKTFY